MCSLVPLPFLTKRNQGHQGHMIGNHVYTPRNGSMGTYLPALCTLSMVQSRLKDSVIESCAQRSIKKKHGHDVHGQHFLLQPIKCACSVPFYLLPHALGKDMKVFSEWFLTSSKMEELFLIGSSLAPVGSKWLLNGFWRFFVCFCWHFPAIFWSAVLQSLHGWGCSTKLHCTLN